MGCHQNDKWTGLLLPSNMCHRERVTVGIFVIYSTERNNKGKCIMRCRERSTVGMFVMFHGKEDCGHVCDVSW